MKRNSLHLTAFVVVAILGAALTTAATNAPKQDSRNSKQCCNGEEATRSDPSNGNPCKSGCCMMSFEAKITDTEKPNAVSFVATDSRADQCVDGQCPTEDKTVCKECAQASCKGNCKEPCDGKCESKCPLCAEGERIEGKCSGDACTEQCDECKEVSEAAVEGESRGVKAVLHRGPMGRQNGHAADSQHQRDHDEFFFLLDHRGSIRRTVKNLANGIETVTESDEPEVANTIQSHVESMYDRMEQHNPIRMRDPLFREIFANADKIEMEVEHTDQGVLVRETSDDAYVVKLLQEHAKVVSLFIKNGYSEMPRNHAAPTR